MSHFLVCWTEQKTGEPAADYWETFERITAAEGLYQQLINDPTVYTASICRPIRSTDYEVTNYAD